MEKDERRRPVTTSGDDRQRGNTRAAGEYNEYKKKRGNSGAQFGESDPHESPAVPLAPGLVP